MAIVVDTLVPHASREQSDRFDDGVDAAMEQRGGPPDGLMVHFSRPSGDGFLLCNVWRSEADMRPFYEEVILPTLAENRLDHEESVISPIWVFAKP